MINACKVANIFLALAMAEGQELTNMAVQKLVYIANGYALAIFDEPLIYNDIQAFIYGPVIPDLYDSLRKYGSGVVSGLIPDEGNGRPTKEQRMLIRTIYESYGHMRSMVLSTITHKKGTPWDITFNHRTEFGLIPDDLIRDYYKELLKSSNKPKIVLPYFRKGAV